MDMKKFFRNFILFLSVISIFIVSASPVFCMPKWYELTQKERDDYIEGCIEDMQHIGIKKFSKDILKEEFGITTSRDPNYREHREGNTSIPGAYISKNYSSYQAPGPHLMGTKGFIVEIPVGYNLSKDGIHLKFNKSGSLQEVEVYSKKTSYSTYFIQSYNKSSLKLDHTRYIDNALGYQVIFDENNDFKTIIISGQTYDINGKKIKIKK